MKKKLKTFDIVKLKNITTNTKTSHGIKISVFNRYRKKSKKEGKTLTIEIPYRQTTHGLDSTYCGVFPANSGDMGFSITKCISREFANNIKVFTMEPYGKYVKQLTDSGFLGHTITAPESWILPTGRRIVDIRDISNKNHIYRSLSEQSRMSTLISKSRDHEFKTAWTDAEKLRKYQAIFFQTPNMNFKQYMLNMLEGMRMSGFIECCSHCGVLLLDEHIASKRYVRKDGSMTIKCPNPKCRKPSFIKIMSTENNGDSYGSLIDSFYISLSKEK